MAITFNNLFKLYKEERHDFTTVTNEDNVITVLSLVLWRLFGEREGREKTEDSEERKVRERLREE